MNDQEIYRLMGELQESIKEIPNKLDNPAPPTKDGWDKFGLWTKFVGSVLLVAIGVVFTFLYNQAQQRIYKLDTLSKFMPFIIHENEDVRQTAVFFAQDLIGTEAATELALLNVKSETPDTLKELSNRDKGKSGQKAISALQRLVKTDAFNLVPVFFVTDRNILEDQSFVDQRGEVSYGKAQVSIPEEHRLGEMESPNIYKLELKEDIKKHLVITQQNRMESTEFFTAIKQQTNQKNEDDLLIYIHGFGMNFDFSVKRLAQLSFDLNLSGTPILYSWPSKKSIAIASSYLVDQTTVRWAASNLKAFIKELTRLTINRKINILASGLGSRMVINALGNLGNKEKGVESSIFKEVVFIYPDVDSDIFKQAAPTLTSIAKRVTVYTSSFNTALKVTSSLNSSPPAGLGLSMEALSGLDIIDVSNKETASLLGAYFIPGRGISIIQDLHFVLRGLSANKRNLKKVFKDGLLKWEIR